MKKKLSIWSLLLVTSLLIPGLTSCGDPIGSTTESQAGVATESTAESSSEESISETETETETESKTPAYVPPTEEALSAANVAVGCPVITNGCINASNQNLTDGDLSTAWQTGYMTNAEQRTFPYEAVIDLTRSYKLCGLLIRPSSAAKDATFDRIKVEVSLDGLTYTEVNATAKTAEEGIEVALDAEARFVRVSSVDLGERTRYGLEIAELEVLSAITTYDNLLPNKRALVMQPGAADLLTAAYRISDSAAGELRFYSDYPDVVSVDEKTGAVTALKNGNANLYVTDGKNTTAIPVTVHTPDPAYRVSTFYLATDGENTREIMALLKESGINFIESCRSKDSYGNLTAEYLRVWAADYGMTTLVADPALSRYRTMTEEEIRAVAAKYKNLPGYAGLYIIDEPLEPTAYAHVYKAMITEDPFCTPHLNLFPPFEKISDYRGYVTDWVATVGGDTLRVLSYDHYPYLTAKRSFREAVYESLDEIRKIALMYDQLDTGYYIQSSGMHNAYRVPSDSELLYNAALGVAYGMKDFKHFVWFTPPYSGSGEHYITGILTPEMEKSEIFEGVKAVNQMLNTLSPILANTDAVEVYHYKGQNGEPIPEDYCITTDKSSIILSLLEDRTTGQQYIVVVNKRFYQDAEISLLIQDEGFTTLCDVTSGKEKAVSVSNGKLSFKLEAGGLRVFKLPEGYNARQSKAVNDGTKESLLTGIGPSVSSSGEGELYAYMLNDTHRTDTGWQTAFKPETAWVLYDLKSEKTFNRVDIYPLIQKLDFFPTALSVWVSNDGVSYRKVAEAKNIQVDKQWGALTFEDTTARYLKISIDDLTDINRNFTVIGEIELYLDKGKIPAMPAFEKPVGGNSELAYLTPEQAGKVAVSYDAVIIDGNLAINDGRADAWLNGKENSLDASSYVSLLGWAGFSQEIASYGYCIDKEEPIWRDSFATHTEQGVLNAGGANAKRFQIKVDLTGLSGTHTVSYLVKLQDGNLVLLHQPITVVLP